MTENKVVIITQHFKTLKPHCKSPLSQTTYSSTSPITRIYIKPTVQLKTIKFVPKRLSFTLTNPDLPLFKWLESASREFIKKHLVSPTHPLISSFYRSLLPFFSLSFTSFVSASNSDIMAVPRGGSGVRRTNACVRPGRLTDGWMVQESTLWSI